MPHCCLMDVSVDEYDVVLEQSKQSPISESQRIPHVIQEHP